MAAIADALPTLVHIRENGEAEFRSDLLENRQCGFKPDTPLRVALVRLALSNESCKHPDVKPLADLGERRGHEHRMVAAFQLAGPGMRLIGRLLLKPRRAEIKNR